MNRLTKRFKPQYIKDKLKNLSVKQQDIAEIYGYHFSYVSHIIAGRRNNKELENHIKSLIKPNFLKKLFNI